MTTTCHPVEPSAPKITKRGLVCLFKLQCSNDRSFYVCVGEADSLYPNAHLLWVDAAKLRLIWRGRKKAGSTTSTQAKSAREDWFTDYKYAERDPIFNRCLGDPDNSLELTKWSFVRTKKWQVVAPKQPMRQWQRLLQSIKHLIGEKKPPQLEKVEVLHLEPSDGISRSLWMLANGVHQFPIFMTSEGDARGLFEQAGLAGYPPIKIKDFWDQQRNRPA